MKSTVPLVLAAAFSLIVNPAIARTVTNTPRSANEQSVNGVAGPPPAKAQGVRQEPDRPQEKVASADDKSSAHPNKKALKKAKVTPPPPMHDPN